LKSRKLSYAEITPKKCDPFQYQHRYQCYYSNKHGNGNVEYIMHCDHSDPRSSSARAELKQRLAWTYAGCILDSYHVIGSKKVDGRYLYENKRSEHEVN